MSRARYQSRRDAAAAWPLLAAFLTSVAHGSDDRPVENDVDVAMTRMPLDERISLVREWWHWNAAVGLVDDIRFAVEALDANVLFGDAAHARAFMNRVYDKLIASVRREAGKDWKP